MPLSILWLGFILANLHDDAPAETIVTSGTVSGAWSAAGSPYIVTGDITVSGSHSIEKGVVARFRAGTGLTVPYGACLTVIGTTDEPVLFTSDQPTPASGSWDGISIVNSSNNNQISNATIEYATVGVQCVGANRGTGKLAATNVTIRYSSSNGVEAVGSGGSTWSGDYGSAMLQFSGCRILHNGQAGIKCLVESPWASGSVGGSVSNCIVANNNDAGIAFYGTGTVNPNITNNTIYGNGGAGVSNASLSIGSQIKNCIIVGNAFGVKQTSGTNPLDISFSDVWGNATNWSGFQPGFPSADQFNISADPRFAAPSSLDFHLKSCVGRWHDDGFGTGSWIVDEASSPCIDAGSFGDPFSSELAPNGGRIDQGSYGNTPYASRSQPSPMIRLATEDAVRTSGVQVVAVGTGFKTGDVLLVQYPGGGRLVAGNVIVENDTRISGEFDFTGATVGYWDVIVMHPDGATGKKAGALFVVNRAFYVNDGSTTDDLFCSATGNDTNDGLSPSSPKASVQSVVSTYDLEPGDTVYIDTGYYAGSVQIGSEDSGSSSLPVRFIASPYGVTIDGNGGGTSGACWYSNSQSGWLLFATQVALSATPRPESYMKVVNAGTGFLFWNGRNYEIRRCDIAVNGTGVFSYRQFVTVSNCLIRNQGTGIMTTSSNLTVQNCTILGKQYGVWGLYGQTIRNSIISASGSNAFALYDPYGGGTNLPSSSDYNLFFTQSGAGIAQLGPTLDQWRAASGFDLHSISQDPLFVDQSGGDYHLQSKAGSYHGGAWTADAFDSPGIDTGDPASSCGCESSWNGGLINLGAYGNTEQAGRSADQDGDGLSNTYEIYRSGTNPARADSDGDGMDDGMELAAGTNPMNPQSYLRVISAGFTERRSGFTITWPAVPGKTYRLQYTDDLAKWKEDLPGSQITATAGATTCEYTDTTVGSSPARFYRVEIVP